MDKVVACLSTRFNALPAPVRAALPKTFEQSAKVHIQPPDGDTIRAAEMETRTEDGRDATFVRVRLSSLYLSCFSSPILDPTSLRMHEHVILLVLVLVYNLAYLQLHLLLVRAPRRS